MYLGVGQADAGASTLSEAIELWQAQRNLPMLAESRTNLAGLHFFRGEYATALAILDDSLAMGEAIGNAWGQSYSLMLRYLILLDQGDFSGTIQAIRRCLPLAKEGGFGYPDVNGNSMLGLAYGMLGQPHLAQAAFELALDAVEQVWPTERATVVLPWAWWKILDGDLEHAETLIAQGRANLNANDLLSFNHVMLALLESDLALRRGQPAEALQAARSIDRERLYSVMSSFRADLLRAEGAALLALGREPDARSVLEEAHASAAAAPSPRALWEITRTLAAAAQHRGDTADAQRWQTAARQHLDYLLQHIDDPQLRASFSRRPEVRTTLEAT